MEPYKMTHRVFVAKTGHSLDFVFQSKDLNRRSAVGRGTGAASEQKNADLVVWWIWNL